MVALDDASIMVIGGETSQGHYSAKTYIFTPGNGSWSDGITQNVISIIVVVTVLVGS